MGQEAYAALAGVAQVLLAAITVITASYVFVFHPLTLPTTPAVWAARVFATLTLGAIMLARRRRVRGIVLVRVLTMCASAALAAYMVDGYLAWADHREQAQLNQQATAPPGADTRPGAEVVRDLRRSGLDAVQGLYPSLWLGGHSEFRLGDTEVFPISGISNALTVLCNESGKWVTYRSDEFGFNNPRGMHQPGAVDAVILGDSFAQGLCVGADETFGALIRRHYPRTISLGIGGAGPRMRLAIWREYAEVLRAPVVVWVHTQGTTDRLDRVTHPILKAYVSDGTFRQGLRSMQGPVDGMLRRMLAQETSARSVFERFRNVFFMPRVRRLLSDVVRRARDTTAARAERARLFASVLKATQAGVEGSGGQLIFVYMPTPGREDSDRDEVTEAARQVGLPVVDLSPAFDRHPDVMSIYPHRGVGRRQALEHFNAEGHRLVADAIMRGVEDVLPLALIERLRQAP